MQGQQHSSHINLTGCSVASSRFRGPAISRHCQAEDRVSVERQALGLASTSKPTAPMKGKPWDNSAIFRKNRCNRRLFVMGEHSKNKHTSYLKCLMDATHSGCSLVVTCEAVACFFLRLKYLQMWLPAFKLLRLGESDIAHVLALFWFHLAGDASMSSVSACPRSGNKEGETLLRAAAHALDQHFGLKTYFRLLCRWQVFNCQCFERQVQNCSKTVRGASVIAWRICKPDNCHSHLSKMNAACPQVAGLSLCGF